MDDDLYCLDFNSKGREKAGPVKYSADFSLEEVEGIREYSALNLNTEEDQDKNIGTVLDILHTEVTQKSLGNVLRLPVSKTTGELSDRIISNQLINDLEEIRNRPAPEIPLIPHHKLFSPDEIKLLNDKNNVKFSSLVGDLPSQASNKEVLLDRSLSPSAFSDLSTSSNSMSEPNSPDSAENSSGKQSPVSEVSSGLIIDDLLDVGQSEDISREKSEALKTFMARGNQLETVEADPPIGNNASLKDDSDPDDQASHADDSQSESSYFEDPEDTNKEDGNKTKEVQTLGAMSALALEVEEANTLLQLSLNHAPEELFKQMDEKTAAELGLSPLMFSGFAYLTKVSNVQMGHIQTLNVVTNDALNVLSRTEEKADALRGDLDRLCSEIGSLTAEVRNNTIGIRMVQSVLEKLLTEGTKVEPENRPPPSSSGISTKPPNNPPTGQSLAVPISYERYMEMGMAERLRYRKAGGIIPKEADYQGSKSLAEPTSSLPLPSQPLVPFTPIETQPQTSSEDAKEKESKSPKAVVTITQKPENSMQEKSRSARTKPKKRTVTWRHFTDCGVSEHFLRLEKEQVLTPKQIEKFQTMLMDKAGQEKETVAGLKATLTELAKKNGKLVRMKDLLRRVNTRDEFFVHLNAMASIHEGGIQEFE